MCDGLGQNKIVKVDIKRRSGFTPFVDFGHENQVREILGQRRIPFVLFNTLARLSVTFLSVDIRH